MRRQTFILLSFSSSKKARKAQETQSCQRFQHVGHTDFNTSGTNGSRSLSWVKVGTHSAFGEGSHTRAHTPKQGRFGWGRYHYPRTVSHVSETLRGRVSERRTLPLLGLGRGCAPEERREPSGQRCAHARRCPEASRPRWAARLFYFCLNCGLYALRSGPFCMCEARGVSPLSACSTCRRNARCPLVKPANSPFPCLARFFFDSSSAKYCPLSLQMPKGPAGYPLVLSLLFASPYLP